MNKDNFKKDILRKATSLRNNPTETEKYLWRYLRNKQLEGFRFRRQHPIGKYIVDFVCLEKKLVIELDGGQHMIEKEKDNKRDVWLKREGYYVLRFWNNDVFTNIEGLLEVIRGSLLSPSPISEKNNH